MFLIFPFIFQLVKIAILSWVYGGLIVALFRWVGEKRPHSWFERFTNNAKRSRSIVRWVVYGALFFYMFTYWGDHGLGDYARIPLGHFKDVQETDARWAYIESKKHGEIGVERFTYDNNYLYAETEGENAKGRYVVWNLRTDEFKEYITEEEYYNAGQTKYPSIATFKNFEYFYRNYWDKRFLFLP